MFETIDHMLEKLLPEEEFSWMIDFYYGNLVEVKIYYEDNLIAKGTITSTESRRKQHSELKKIVAEARYYLGD